jgi:hypothetical protein
MCIHAKFLLFEKGNDVRRRVPRVGRVSVAQAYAPSIPNTSSTRCGSRIPKSLLDLAYANRPHPIEECMISKTGIMLGSTRLLSKYNARAGGMNSHAPFTNPQTMPHAFNTASTPPSLL